MRCRYNWEERDGMIAIYSVRKLQVGETIKEIHFMACACLVSLEI